MDHYSRPDGRTPSSRASPQREAWHAVLAFAEVRDGKGELITSVYAGFVRILELQATTWRRKLLASMVPW